MSLRMSTTGHSNSGSTGGCPSGRSGFSFWRELSPCLYVVIHIVPVCRVYLHSFSFRTHSMPACFTRHCASWHFGLQRVSGRRWCGRDAVNGRTGPCPARSRHGCHVWESGFSWRWSPITDAYGPGWEISRPRRATLLRTDPSGPRRCPGWQPRWLGDLVRAVKSATGSGIAWLKRVRMKPPLKSISPWPESVLTIPE